MDAYFVKAVLSREHKSHYTIKIIAFSFPHFAQRGRDYSGHFFFFQKGRIIRGVAELLYPLWGRAIAYTLDPPPL